MFPIRPILLILLITVLSACATQTPAPVEQRSPEAPPVAERVRAPAAEETRGVQVFPLRNPAVTELTEAADRAEQDGDLSRAALLLERALRIEPRDPELLQHMADLQLAQERWEQAEQFASRSFDVGPRVGELCQRNWRTIALARERAERYGEAQAARDRLAACVVEPPPRF